MNLRLLAIISAVLTVLVGIDGIYMVATHYGSTENFNLSDGWTVVIAAILLLILTIVAFVMSSRQSRATTTDGRTDNVSANDTRGTRTEVNG